MKKRKKHRLLFFLIYMSLCTILFFLVIRLIEIRTLPTIKKIAEYELGNTINLIINKAVKETVMEHNTKTSDFIEMTINGVGDISFLSSNTMLINSICSDVSTKITNQLMESSDFYITIPSGLLTGLEILSGVGPALNMHIVPYGAAHTEYGTEFRAAGINQTNFIIWLDAEIKMQPIIPLFNDVIPIKRRITLVNSVINGNVPEMYLKGPLGMGAAGE